MILTINTTGDQKSVALYWPGKIKKAIFWQENQISSLEKIDQLLKKNHFKPKDIKLIVVNRGPGSFTGVRLGVAIANTLSASLQIPILGLVDQEDHLSIFKLAKLGLRKRKNAKVELILPYYDKEANITFPVKDKNRKKFSI